MSRFIKFIPSEKSDFLQEYHPNAFLLLCQIAKRARRMPGELDGLQVGDALLGDYKSAGLTRQQYRTALEKLVEFKIIEIIYNGKTFLKREKSTIKITIKGMLVNLIDSSIWDINAEGCNQHSNQRATNEQPTSNHEQERTRKNKKEEETTTPLTPQGESVVVLYDCLKENKNLTDDEKEYLQRFEEKRVKLALDFVKTDKPKTTLIQTLVWHCKEKNAPRPSGRRYTDQQRMAIDFNAYLLSIGQEVIYQENLKNIEEGAYILIPLHGQPQTVSLKNSIEDLKRDFKEVRLQQPNRKFG